MDQDNNGVETDTELVTDSPTEENQSVNNTEPAVNDAEAELVDEKGVPLKNRQAEATRKARKMTQAEAQSALAGQPVDSNEQTDEAIRIVESIAEQKVAKRLEPILVKQFLADNPDAKDMIEQINNVRSANPAIAGIDQLETAYKVVKAEMQDEIIRQKVEAERQTNIEKTEKSTSATIDGVGKIKAPQQTISDQINDASSLEELKKIETALVSR